MDIFTYLRHKNIISLILVSVISFYILRLIDVSVDTFYPVIQMKIKTKDISLPDSLTPFYTLDNTSEILVYEASPENISKLYKFMKNAILWV